MKVKLTVEIEEDFGGLSAVQWEEVLLMVEEISKRFKETLESKTEVKLDFKGIEEPL